VTRDLGGVLDAVLAAIVVVDRSLTIEFVNSAACRMLESSQESLEGMALEQLHGPAHPALRLAREVLASARAASQSEVPIERRFEDALEVDLSVSPLFDTEGDDEPSGVVLVMRDRTLQKDREEWADERERFDAFGQIAAGIAHEVKNPLGGIRGAAEIIGSRSGDHKTKSAADLVVREVDRITSLVDGLMVFTHGGDLAFESFNIHRVLDDVLTLLDHDPLGDEADVLRLYDPSIPDLTGDPRRLTQVFLNLTRNALQAMHEDSESADRQKTLTITTRMTLDYRLSTPGHSSLPTVLISISDTGPGIPDDVQGQLGTPFFTTRDGGTGLGLAVSKQWVARHGGVLRIESALGEGTTVRVALPVEQPGTEGATRHHGEIR